MYTLTYSPNWKSVIYMIDQAKAMTSEHAYALGRAWGAAWIAADEQWDEARRNVWEAAFAADRTKDRHVMKSVVWDVARDRARVATCDAIEAVAIKDLIGTQTYEQADYDMLVGPWESVMGSISDGVKTWRNHADFSANCDKCGESYQAADEDDLEHFEDHTGTECGGTGTITELIIR